MVRKEKEDVQKTIRCAKDNKMCKKMCKKTTRCAKNNKMYKKRKNSVLGLNK